MKRTILLACFLAQFATAALAQGACTQGVRIISAYYAEEAHREWSAFQSERAHGGPSHLPVRRGSSW